MTSIERAWDVLTTEQRQKLSDEIIAWFHQERGEEIGAIAASQLLDFMLSKLHAPLYNKALDDLVPLLK